MEIGLSYSSLPFLAKSPKPVATTATSSGGGLTGFLREKTGVTGAWTLGLGLSAYFLSKEFYVVDGEVSIVSWCASLWKI